MSKALKAVLVVLLSLFFAEVSFGEIIADPTKWTFEAKKKSGSEYELIVHCKIDKGWHIWSFNPGGDGLEIAPQIKFKKNSNVIYNGPVTEHGKMITEDMDVVGVVHMYKDKVDYIQKATVSANTKISGTYYYQTCNDNMCLPDKKPTSFTIVITDAGGTAISEIKEDSIGAAVADTQKSAGDANGTANVGETPKDTASKTVLQSAAGKSGDNAPQKSLIRLFLLAFVGGLLAVLTPCVYSMIPITVSFFTKRSKTRKEGIRNALYYCLSIVLIFTFLGVFVTLVFGATSLNTLSTKWFVNMFFFFVFVIFGISFLGAFEITLPSSWTNKTDSKAGVGSFSGIFFMALTLAIVSFSCTGPIVGPLLVEAGQGGVAGPVLGMLGFSLGLALPFGLFAIFPGMLNKMASSGGWHNQVKVVLGFVELMLAFKFLSNADL
ncbi:MAG: hypothetical protein H7257_01085, partial [Taibaiella sp.]|nr:hypothetical protein [Taibaiella sp.]